MRLTVTIIFPKYTTIAGKQCSFLMPKHQIAQHLYRTKCSFFPNCKRLLCITTFELLRTSSRSLLHNTVVESKYFQLLKQVNKYYLYNYKLTKKLNQEKIEKLNIKLVISQIPVSQNNIRFLDQINPNFVNDKTFVK